MNSAAASDAPKSIHTPADGLTAGHATYPVNGFAVPCYYAAPAGRSDLPVVLVVQEIFGVHPYIEDTCRRFAHQGYLAIAPDLFVRQGNAGNYSDMGKLMAELVSQVPDAQVMADLDGAVAWAGGHGGNPDKLAITGFCWGGRATWLYCAHNPNVKAGVAWYGRLVGENTLLRPQQPVDIAGQLKARVLGLYGAQDGGIPVDTVQQMQVAMAAAAASGNVFAGASQWVVYPQAGHAFHADYRPGYQHEAAQDGWRRTLDWFRNAGVV